MKISKFFNDDYVNQASYDNLRKIASLVDGQKNASRKILYTILEKNIKSEIKVSQLGSKVAEFAEYLHGSMDGVIVGLAQNYPGTNNIPLLVREGNFGTRFSNEASASRYIFTHGSDEFFELFNKQDNDILVKQYFEGEKIEPMFYVPNLPILLINGSEGVSSGFAQKILPRDPKKVKQYIKDVLTENYKPRKSNDLTPYYEGFKGTIEQGENPAQWLIKGIVERKGINRVQIKEIPVGYDLRSYIKVLDTLEDNRIIQSYDDKSEDDNFLFNVTIPSKDLKEWDDEELLTRLKLIKKVTENYTVIDETNKIKVYDTAEQIIQHYIGVKKEYVLKRKVNRIEKLTDEVQIDKSRYLFIKMIVDETLKINKRKKADIVADLEKVPDIITQSESYDYLLNMNIVSLTEERMEKIELDIASKLETIDKLKNTSIEELWMEEL